MFHCPYCRRHFFFRLEESLWQIGILVAGALGVAILYVLAWKLLVMLVSRAG